MEEFSVILSSIGSLQACCANPVGTPRSNLNPSCELDCNCPKLLRQLFYQLWHASETHFRNQQDAMKLFCSRSHFETHVEQHADLTHALTEIMAGYRMSRSCHEVFAEIRKFAEKLDRHQQTLDAELLLQLRQAGAAQDRLPVATTVSASVPA